MIRSGAQYNSPMGQLAAEIKLSTQELPTWMRQARQRVDWGVLLVVLFSALAAAPWITRDGVPRTNAAENHIYMAAETLESLQEGRLYPRWSSTTNLGYGAPVPNYIPPGTAYSTAVIQALFAPDSTVKAMRLVLIAAMGWASGLTYVLVLRLANAAAGVIAALLFTFSPYVLLTAPHVLGDYPAVLSLSLTPLLMWGTMRLMALNHPFDAVIVALATAGLLLVKPEALAAALILLGPLLLRQALIDWRWLRFLTTILALLLGAALAAFYWLPALAEQSAIIWASPQAPPLAAAPEWPTLLLSPPSIDLNEMVAPVRYSLGSTLIVFAAAFPLLLLLRLRGQSIRRAPWLQWVRRPEATHIAFALQGIGFAAAALNLPDGGWLLGPAALALAVAGSGLIHLRDSLPRELERTWTHLLALVILSAAIVEWQVPDWPGSFGDTSAAARLNHELQGFGVAVLPPDAAVPSTLPQTIVPNRDLVNSILEGQPLRVPNIRLTGEKRADLLASESHQDRYLVTTNQAVVFDVLRAGAPGWQAALNGERIPLETNPATGLMQVRVPEVRESTLTFTMGATPARSAAWALSTVALLVLAVATTLRLVGFQSVSRYDPLRYLSTQEARLLGIIGIGTALIVGLLIPPGAPLTLYQPPGHGLDGYTELRYRTDVGIEALAYRIHTDARTLNQGQSLRLTLAWRTSVPLRANYQVRLHLRDAPIAPAWEQTDARAPGGYPTRRWTADRYIRDPHTLLLDDIIPGTYQVAVELYLCEPDCSPQNRVTFFDPQGNAIGQTLLLPPRLTVRGS